MTAAEQVLAAVETALQAKQIQTVFAWHCKKLPHLEGAAVVLGVQETESDAAALWNYLGEVWDETLACVKERYGKRFHMILFADIYAPRGKAEEVETCCAALEEILISPVLGLHAESVRRSAVDYDSASGYLKCRCSVSCTAYFTALRTEESATLTDFQLKGVLQ